MLGVLLGLKVTIKHFFSRKLTRMYPYEKRMLPERSRGLIQLITEPETGGLKCESCLLCEKACPPRAITIRYERRGAFRYRPMARPKSRAAYYRPRLAAAYPYQGPRPVSAAVLGSEAEPDVDLEFVERLVAEQEDLLGVLQAVQDAYGHLPRAAVEKVAEVSGARLSDLFSLISLSPSFRLGLPRGSASASEAADDARALVLPGAEVVAAVAQPALSGGGAADD